MRLDGINIKKEFDNLMETYRPFSELAQEEVVFGKDNLMEKYLHLYKDKYPGLLKYNLLCV